MRTPAHVQVASLSQSCGSRPLGQGLVGVTSAKAAMRASQNGGPQSCAVYNLHSHTQA